LEPNVAPCGLRVTFVTSSSGADLLPLQAIRNAASDGGHALCRRGAGRVTLHPLSFILDAFGMLSHGGPQLPVSEIQPLLRGAGPSAAVLLPRPRPPIGPTNFRDLDSSGAARPRRGPPPSNLCMLPAVSAQGNGRPLCHEGARRCRNGCGGRCSWACGSGACVERRRCSGARVPHCWHSRRCSRGVGDFSVVAVSPWPPRPLGLAALIVIFCVAVGTGRRV
jgi:hypothetical protein